MFTRQYPDNKQRASQRPGVQSEQSLSLRCATRRCVLPSRMGCAGSAPEGSGSAQFDALAAAPPIGEQTRREIERQQHQHQQQQPSPPVPLHAQGSENDKELQAALAFSRFTAEEELRAQAQPTDLARQSSDDELRSALALSRTMHGAPTVWLKGVGTAFEALFERQWAPVTERSIIDPLGRLCADKTLEAVEYVVGGRTVRAVTTLEPGLAARARRLTLIRCARRCSRTASCRRSTCRAAAR